MASININDMQHDPLGYLRRVEQGETLLVLRGEQPVAEIKPVPALASQPRPFGLCAGAFIVPDGFDRPLPEELLRDFEGP